MKRDSIFYKIFQQFPSLLFDLVETTPPSAREYRFDSVEVKEPTFRIDGVFLPPETAKKGIIYFCEVQFQKDDLLYERIFAELFLYFYQNRDRFDDWYTVAIYPSQSLEQKQTKPYRSLINCDQVKRIYLNKLGNIRQLPIRLAVMVLTTLSKKKTSEEARHLLQRIQIEEDDTIEQSAIISLVTTIVSYKFSKLGREEVEKMLELDIKQVKAFQEVREEGRQEGRIETKLELVARLLARGMSVEEIASILDLTIEQVQQAAAGESTN